MLNDDHTSPFDPLGTCVWVRNFWWTTGACQVLSAARTRFEPSSSSSSCSCRIRRVSCSLILKMKLVPPSLPRSSCSFVLLVDIVALVLVFYLCPSSVRVLATFPGTVLFPLLCSVLPFFEPRTPNTAVRCTHSSWYVLSRMRR